MILSLIVPTIVSPNQHGFIPEKGIQSCWAQVLIDIKTKRWIYEFDLEAFFDTISHDLIRGMLAGKLKVP